MIQNVICINKVNRASKKNKYWSLLDLQKITRHAPLRFKEESHKLGLNFFYFRIFKKDRHVKTKLRDFHQHKISPKNTIIIPRNPHFYKDFPKFTFNLKPIKQFARLGYTIFNLECLLNFPKLEDKLAQYQAFKKFNHPLIPTYFSENLEKLAKKVRNKYPLIVKPRWGSLGRGIELLKNENALRKFAAKYPIRMYVLQDFIPNKFDFRVITSPAKVLGALKRQRQTGIINNYSAGAKISNYSNKLTTEIKSLSRKICRDLKADYLGIDLMFDQNTKKLYLIEINRFFQFEGFEKATKLNIAGDILGSLIKKHHRS